MEDIDSFKPGNTFLFRGNSINYEKMGHGGQVLVFLHGFAMSLNAWNDIRYKFPLEQYTLLLPDLKGCGFSKAGPEEDFSLAAQTDMLTELLRDQRINKFVLIGHSYGGLVALYLQHVLKKGGSDITISNLVLIDAPAYPEHVPGFIKALRNPLLGFITLNLISARWNAGFIIRQTFYDWKAALRRLYKKYAFFLEGADRHKAFKKLARQVMPVDLNELVTGYKRISIPTLVIWGKEDKLIPLKYGERLSGDIPGAQLFSLPECGHVPQEERPDITFDIVRGFIEQNALPAGSGQVQGPLL